MLVVNGCFHEIADENKLSKVKLFSNNELLNKYLMNELKSKRIETLAVKFIICKKPQPIINRSFPRVGAPWGLKKTTEKANFVRHFHKYQINEVKIGT